MLPSNKRLSRLEFKSFLEKGSKSTVFNSSGTLKYLPAEILKASVVISSKVEKRAVLRNKTKRRVYSILSLYEKDFGSIFGIYVFYISKNIKNQTFLELKQNIYDLIKKNTK